jgi:hypothetical protein
MKKPLKDQTIQIAVTAISVWREMVKRREGLHESPRFFQDIKQAQQDLKRYLPKA